MRFCLMPKTRSKSVDYPVQTAGSSLAAKVRAKANALPEAKRAGLFNKGMAMIYGSAGKKAARS